MLQLAESFERPLVFGSECLGNAHRGIVIPRHERAELAYEVLSRYLEVSGDYGGSDVLRFYLVYRALVRAKVAAIKRAQSAADGHEAERYLKTATDLAAPKTPLLVITHGLSGSGKTTVTDELVGRLIVAVVNFPPRQIGPFMSEVLTLGVPDASGGVVLLSPEREVPVGGRMF